MQKALLFFIAFFYLQVNFSVAQKKVMITYTHESRMQFKTEVETTNVEAEEDEFGFGDLKALLDSIAKPQATYLSCWRQGGDVVMVRKETGSTPLHTYFDVDKLVFKVVDSSNFEELGKADTIITPWYFKNNPDWQVTYNVTKNNKHKKILDYACELYTIEEIKITERNGKPDKRTISLWVTNAIKPAISTHAVLALYDKVLGNFTPLEAEITRVTENGGTYQKLTAIEIADQP